MWPTPNAQRRMKASKHFIHLYNIISYTIFGASKALLTYGADGACDAVPWTAAAAAAAAA